METPPSRSRERVGENTGMESLLNRNLSRGGSELDKLRREQEGLVLVFFKHKEDTDLLKK